jgi:hypothetical protein
MSKKLVGILLIKGFEVKTTIPFSVYCIIKMDTVAKENPHFCNSKIPKIAKVIAGTQ